MKIVSLLCVNGKIIFCWRAFSECIVYPHTVGQQRHLVCMGGYGWSKGTSVTARCCCGSCWSTASFTAVQKPDWTSSAGLSQSCIYLGSSWGRGWIVWEIMVITCLIDQSLFQAETKGSLGVLRKFGSGIDDGIGCKADDIFADQALGFLGDLIPWCLICEDAAQSLGIGFLDGIKLVARFLHH